MVFLDMALMGKKENCFSCLQISNKPRLM